MYLRIIMRCQIETAWRKDARAASEKVAHNRLAGRSHFARVSPPLDAAPGGLCARQARRPR
jgi:hypothetical protein